MKRGEDVATGRLTIQPLEIEFLPHWKLDICKLGGCDKFDGLRSQDTAMLGLIPNKSLLKRVIF